MNKNGFSKSLTIATGLTLLIGAPASSHAESVSQEVMRAPTPVSPVPLLKADPLPDYFAGLDYTDEQKAEIARIRHNIDARRRAVEGDDRLTQDQKDAMILGYTRLENGEIFKVLTLEQRRQVRQKLEARREAGQPAQKKRRPENKPSQAN